MTVNFDQFIQFIIQAGQWELRFTQQHFAYAYLPHGFGQDEEGIQLHFNPLGNMIKVTGVIEHSQFVRIKRPFVQVSLYSKPEAAVEQIKSQLLPQYQSEWYAAQPKIREYFQRRGEREQVIKDLTRMLNFSRSFDPDRGVDVLTTQNAEAILNADMSVSLKINVSLPLAARILSLIRDASDL